MRLLQIGCCFLLLGLVSAKVRYMRVQKSKRLPIYSSMEQESQEDKVEEDIVSVPIIEQTQFKPLNEHNQEHSEGRLLKHLLLLKQFSDSGNNGNGGNGDRFPYIIVNNPSRLTNINTNLIDLSSNDTTITGTGTGTGTGTTMNRIAGGYYPIAMPTPVYQQRGRPYAQLVYGPPPQALRQINRRPNRNRANPQYNVRQNPFAALANGFRRIEYA